VVTNALNIANELVVRRHVKLVVTGSVARPASYELIGPLATELPAEIALNRVFIGVDGIDVAHGATAHHEGEAGINRALARRAQQVIVVADASKLARRAFARICPVEDVHVLVTDRDADGAAALAEPLPAGVLEAEQFTFLGRGWAYGIAQEAALKMREAAGAWTEAYPVMEYRHGPIGITGPGRVVVRRPDGRARRPARRDRPYRRPVGGAGARPGGRSRRGSAAGRRPGRGARPRSGQPASPHPFGDPGLMRRACDGTA
jgi:hypothetical protein